MPLRFLKLFRTNVTEPSDGLAQPEREAILDALNFLTYLDNHLSSAEDTIIQNWTATLDWDKNLSLSSYETKSISNARHAKESVDYRKEFKDSITGRLTSNEAKVICISLLERLAHADGRSPTEIEFITELNSRLRNKNA